MVCPSPGAHPPVTADDAWRHMRPALGLRPPRGVCAGRAVPERGAAGKWERLLGVREAVLAALEEKLKDKVIGKWRGGTVMADRTGAGWPPFSRGIASCCPCSSSDPGGITADNADESTEVEVEKAPGSQVRTMLALRSGGHRNPIGRASATGAWTLWPNRPPVETG